MVPKMPSSLSPLELTAQQAVLARDVARLRLPGAARQLALRHRRRLRRVLGLGRLGEEVGERVVIWRLHAARNI